MSRNFEEEYKEYLNAQAPDLWGRIEDGINALPRQNSAAEANVVPIRAGKKKRGKKKKQIRYQHYRTIVSAAACLFALLLIIPVYMLVKPSEKENATADSAEQIVLTDATITNTTEETVTEEAAVEESAPKEPVVPEETAVEESDEVSELQPEEQADSVPGEVLSEEETTQLASAGTGDGTSEMTAQLEDGFAEEVLQVTVLSEDGRQEAGMMYSVAIAGDASAEALFVIVPDDSPIVLEVGGQYTLTLQQFVEEGYRVVMDALKQ